MQNTEYVIYREGRRYNNKTFGSYEAARKYAVRKIRQLTSDMVLTQGKYPTLNTLGFSVRKAVV